jgi:hypothetical protein|tara:strand:+ start:518 stop:916 length:399 start_codon:yes stop_codon:yes gene_type:complete
MVARAKTKKMYRTMQGRMVDIEQLRSANESTLAVGNMNVNARGDVLGAGGQIVTPKETVIKKYYEQPKGMVDDTPIRNKPTPVSQPQAKAVETKAVKTKAVEPKKAATPRVATPKKTVAPKKGIDEALDGLE